MDATDTNQLPAGWHISSRLAAAFKLGDGSLIEYDGATYWITDDAGKVLDSGDDYRPSPLHHSWSPKLGGLLSFLSHAAEQYRYNMGDGEPDDGWTFNAAVGEWAYMHDDELQMCQLDLDESEGN